MDRGPARSALRDIRTLYALGTLGGLTDAELLERFLARRGADAEEAFAALVQRHGPTVLGVCQRMLPGSHDAEDAFQATFLVLARRAASIDRRERLASWLYSVAVRIAKDARRRSARLRAAERRLMDLSRPELEQTEDRDDVIPLLDEELSRLPGRYQSAILTCELEGKSRREAARELGIPEGTLSTYLARGRKLLRERLSRRGVNLGVGTIATASRPLVVRAIPDRLMETTVRVALAASPGATAAVPVAVSSLAERVLKMMVLVRLTLILASLIAAGAGTAAAMVLTFAATAAAPQAPAPPKAGPDDFPGRVVDKTGAGVADVQVWAIRGPHWARQGTVARATTDSQGRFAVPWTRDREGLREPRNLYLFARSRDGRVGWLDRPASRIGAEIELMAVGDVRGRLTDQEGRPIAGVEVAPTFIRMRVTPLVCTWINPELTDLFRTTTAADGSFLIKGIPQGAAIWASIAAPAYGAPAIWWETSQAVTIALDGRLGRIKGRLKPPEGRELPGGYGVGLRGAPLPEHSAARPFEVSLPERWAPTENESTLRFIPPREASAEKDGSFQLDRLPPGRYLVNAHSGRDDIDAEREIEVEVGPGAVAQVEIPFRRIPMIAGRIVDARTGKGVAGVDLNAWLWPKGDNQLKDIGMATTDADGRYRIRAEAGKMTIQFRGVPKTYLGLAGNDFPMLDVQGDRTWPDLKLAPAAGLDGLVVDGSGRPAAGADVYFLSPNREGGGSGGQAVSTGREGTFHLDEIDPDGPVSLWARAGDATTDGTITVRPDQVKGKVTLTVDPKHAFSIRGLATDANGKRIAGASVMLGWLRPTPDPRRRRDGTFAGGLHTPLAIRTTGEDGWFVFRRLWPGLSYDITIETKGYRKTVVPDLTGKAGETRDVGKLVLLNTAGYVAGRVVGSDGRPIAQAAVSKRGDSPEAIATFTDPEGRFRLEGMLAGTRFVFVRKAGYRFTGVKTDGDADNLTITLLKTTEPPSAWKPGHAASRDEQRAFAKQLLMRVWEKYGADAENNGAVSCIEDMAEIDPDLARRWSADKGHAHDDEVRFGEARTLAETNAEGALGLLNQKPDSKSQRVLQELSDWYADADPKKSLRFAEEAAVQARGLNQPDRTLAMARAGAVLVKLGRPDAGRKLIDEAGRHAAELALTSRAGARREQTARILAPYDLERALAIIEPLKAPHPNWWQRNRAIFAAAIARIDTPSAIALADSVESRGSDRERALTAIAYQIGRDRPDEAIKIIEGMNQRRDAIPQAEAFAWLAVALAPRDRIRANALIDRALALLIDNEEGERSGRSGGETAAAARIAACARQIGYPDMDSVIVRVLATRTDDTPLMDREWRMRSYAVAAVYLALVDPGAARTVLEQVEARGGIDPATVRQAREPWLQAWALVDLTKATAVFDATLAALDKEKAQGPWGTGLFETAELLMAPPERRAQVLVRGSGGGYWRPDGEP
jgi:RNA polymerase sigma factor (sigma-70 family)